MELKPHGLRPPTELKTDEFVLRPIRASDAEFDYDAVMENKEFLRKWEQTGWPEDNFTVQANREDLVRLEQRHINGESFAYTVESPTADQCLGCVYMFPTNSKVFTKARVTAISGAQWSDFEFATYFWVRKARMIDQLDERLLKALGLWLEREWHVTHHLVVTSELVEQQVALIETSGRSLHFELAYPNKTGRELAYAWPNTALGEA